MEVVKKVSDSNGDLIGWIARFGADVYSFSIEVEPPISPRSWRGCFVRLDFAEEALLAARKVREP